MSIKKVLLEAVASEAKAKRAEANATIALLLEHPAAIGEHTKTHYVEDLYAAFAQKDEAEGILSQISSKI